MHRVGKWLERGRLQASASSQSLDSLAEYQNLESAMRASELIMDDDIEGAEKGLSQGNSAFHKLSRGVIGFMKATLGFEQDIMKQASEQLSDAETSAYNDLYRAQHNTRSFDSKIYDKGSEFALCQAEAQIMGAVVGVLNESLTDSIRAFYKLRKAYVALDGLMQMESAFLKSGGATALANSRPQSSESLQSEKSETSSPLEAAAGGKRNSKLGQNAKYTTQPSSLRKPTPAEDVQDEASSDSDEFFEADEIHDTNPSTKTYTGKIGPLATQPEPHDQLEALSLSNHTRTKSSMSATDRTMTASTTSYDLLSSDPDSPIFSNSVDAFIHSGTNLCFGMLSLMISSIPPTFGKLLFVIGFRGDREKGMRMLWQASKFSNIHGGLAGLIILGWYNGLVGFCDMIADTDLTVPEEEKTDGYPTKRLQALLLQMKTRYPKSNLWTIQEALMANTRRRLDTALDLLSQPMTGKSQLKQVQALRMFEKGLASMNAHRYQVCADSFLLCVDLNSWSQALYYYIIGSSHLQLYRNFKSQPGKEKETFTHKTLAEEYMRTATAHTGKKKVMGRELPFDVFVKRKIAKWEARSQLWECDLMDAIGISPLEEMIYFWNGYKRMGETDLLVSLENLTWSESTENSYWAREELDERAISAVLRAVIFRNLRRHEESKKLLQDEVLCHDHNLFKGHQRDDWTAPVAHYEMAVNLWMERTGYVRQYGRGIVHSESVGDSTLPPDLARDTKLVQECKKWVEKVKGWGKYELDARVGLKVTAAYDAVKKWEETNL